MKINVGILIHGDPTRGGTITSEVKFLKSLYENNSNDSNFYLITVNPSVTKRVAKDNEKVYDFPHEVVPIFSEEDFYKLEHFSCILTYPGHSNFFGGYLNDNIVKMYKILSKCTNDLNIPVFIRINDSEIKVRDYRKLSKVRLDAGYEARKEGKPDSAFMKDPLNVAKAEDLVSWKECDYSKIFWFANGSKEACDWVAETMYDREDEIYRMAPRETFVKNSIYVSDDIFFLVRKNYERFKKYDVFNPHIEDKFCYIGFFDTVNVARGKALNTLFRENLHAVNLKIFGKGTEILTKLKNKPNIEIEEGFIKGDSEEYFDFLNTHLAYIFIGKGQTHARYIGKTVYDAIVARTPIVVYKKADMGHITFESDEYYFENEKELKDIQNKLKDPIVRSEWIKNQTEEIFRKLPPSSFNFNLYCDSKEELKSELCYKLEDLKITPKKETQSKSISLF